LFLNHAKTLMRGIVYTLIFNFFVIIFIEPIISSAPNAIRRFECAGKLQSIGLALHNYHDANKHFPTAYTCDQDGKALFSWRVEILPMKEYGSVYDLIKKDEPWNSSCNTQVISRLLEDYVCPSDYINKIPFPTSYMAVIGPGTAWREDGPVKFSDLPDHGSHTVMAVEVANSGVHWAEPRDLTVDEALENMKTGQGMQISSSHPGVSIVLFADCTVRSLPSKMPISLWKKLLAGEVKDLDNIDKYINPTASDMVDVYLVPTWQNQQTWIIILNAGIWLISVVLLFRRAIKSRRVPVIDGNTE
jgi:hypothetical protein